MRALPLCAVILVSALTIAPCVRLASACSTAPATIEWLADHAAQVFVCEVAETRSYWTQDPRRIESEVTLRDVSYLKGAGGGERSTKTLVFPGGTVGETTMRLCCAPTIEGGQSWIIFLQAEYRTFPSPAMGQGMFRVVEDASGEVRRVYNAGGRPIVAIDASGVPIAGGPARSRASARQVGSRGAIQVLSIENAGRALRPGDQEAMTLDAFLEHVSPILQQSRAIGDSQPAGRRIETDLIPVPLARKDGTPEEHAARIPAAEPSGRGANGRPPKRELPQSEGDGR